MHFLTSKEVYLILSQGSYFLFTGPNGHNRAVNSKFSRRYFKTRDIPLDNVTKFNSCRPISFHEYISSKTDGFLTPGNHQKLSGWDLIARKVTLSLLSKTDKSVRPQFKLLAFALVLLGLTACLQTKHAARIGKAYAVTKCIPVTDRYSKEQVYICSMRNVEDPLNLIHIIFDHVPVQDTIYIESK